MHKNAIRPFAFDPAGLKFQIELLAPDIDPSLPWQAEASTHLIAQVWAGVLSIAAQETTDAEQQSNRRSMSLIIRHRSDLSSVNNVIYDNRSFDLQTMLDPDQSKRWLILQVRSTVAHV